MYITVYTRSHPTALWRDAGVAALVYRNIAMISNQTLIKCDIQSKIPDFIVLNVRNDIEEELHLGTVCITWSYYVIRGAACIARCRPMSHRSLLSATCGSRLPFNVYRELKTFSDVMSLAQFKSQPNCWNDPLVVKSRICLTSSHVCAKRGCHYIEQGGLWGLLNSYERLVIMRYPAHWLCCPECHWQSWVRVWL